MVIKIFKIVFPLLLGLIYYYLFRSQIVFFEFFNIEPMNFKYTGVVNVLNGVIPDFLWMYALSMSLFLVWKKHKKIQILVIIVLSGVALLYELLQMGEIISGVFDYFDIVAMLIAILVAYKTQ